MMRQTSVLVVGGGVSGLATAYALRQSGIDVLVAEKSDRLGGLITTTHRDGFLMDSGPDAFLIQKRRAKALCEKLGLADELIPTNPDRQKVYVLFRGRLRALPAGMRLTVPTEWLPLLTSDLFTWSGKLRMLQERWVPCRSDESEESVASFITRRFGEEALERVGEPLLAGIHCGDASRLSIDFLFPRLVALEKRFGSVTKGMMAAEAGGSAFASLRGGMSRLIDALADAVGREGVLLGHDVSAVRRGEGPQFIAALSSGDAIGARAVVLALPLSAMPNVLRETFPDVAATIERIPTVSSAVVFHAFDADAVSHALDAYGFVVPEGEPSRLLAATFASTKFPGRAPDGGILIRTFLGGPNDPEALALADDDLIELSLRELSAAIGTLDAPRFSKVTRWMHRTPQVELGHDRILSDLDDALAPTKGLYVQANGLRSVGIPDTIGEAERTAEAVGEFLRG